MVPPSFFFGVKHLTLSNPTKGAHLVEQLSFLFRTTRSEYIYSLTWSMCCVSSYQAPSRFDQSGAENQQLQQGKQAYVPSDFNQGESFDIELNYILP